MVYLSLKLRPFSIPRDETDCFTFIYVGGQSSHEDLARVALDTLSVLVREAVWRAEAGETLIATLVIRETIFHREKRGVA